MVQKEALIVLFVFCCVEIGLDSIEGGLMDCCCGEGEVR